MGLRPRSGTGSSGRLLQRDALNSAAAAEQVAQRPQGETLDL
jgi:hypothetical protein